MAAPQTNTSSQVGKTSERVVHILLLVVTLLVFLPLLQHMIVERAFDYPQHIAFAEQMRAGTRPTLPHPVFHLALIGIEAVLPGVNTLQEAALLLMLGVSVWTARVIYAGYVRPAFGEAFNGTAGTLALLVTLVLLVIGPINLLTWHRQNLYLGYFMPNLYHNPTLSLLKPLALLHFPYAVGVFSTHAYFASRRAVLISIVLLIVGTLTKPNYAMALFPVMCAAAAYRFYRKAPVQWRLLFWGILIPAGGILAGQYLLLNQAELGGGGMAVRPFAYFQHWQVADHLFLRCLFSVLFPLAVYGLYFKQARDNVWFNLAWLLLAVGALYAYLLVESVQVWDGNFVWSAHVAVTLLFCVAGGFFLRQIYHPAAGLSRDWRALMCMVILSLHMVSGVFWWLFQYRSIGAEWF